jgi:hypothetical protein
LTDFQLIHIWKMKVKLHHGPLAEFTPDILHNMDSRGYKYFAAHNHTHVLENGKLGNCLLVTPFKTEKEAIVLVDSVPPHRYNQVFLKPEVVPEILEGNHFITTYILLPPEFVI